MKNIDALVGLWKIFEEPKLKKIMLPELAEVNDKVRGTDLNLLEGKKLVIKRKGKKRTICKLFGVDISIDNELLNFNY